VKALLDRYFEGFIEYAGMLQDEYSLTNKQIIGVLQMSVNPKLSKLSASWKKVAPIAAGFDNIPDGEYIGDLKEMKLGESKKGRIQVVVEWEVADGEFAGKTQKQFYGLSDDKGASDETGMGYFKNVCEVIGLDLPEDLNLWQETMDEFVANNLSLFDITAKANGQYVNVYVNGVSEYTKGGGEEAQADGDGEVAEEVAEEVQEVVEEQVIEEAAEEVQEITPPVRKTLAKPAAKPVAKAVAKPAAKPVAMPAKKIVSLKRK
jgi:hypothetical protein